MRLVRVRKIFLPCSREHFAFPLPSPFYHYSRPTGRRARTSFFLLLFYESVKRAQFRRSRYLSALTVPRCIPSLSLPSSPRPSVRPGEFFTASWSRRNSFAVRKYTAPQIYPDAKNKGTFTVQMCRFCFYKLHLSFFPHTVISKRYSHR